MIPSHHERMHNSISHPGRPLVYWQAEGGKRLMHYLYGTKKGVPRRLVATFDSEQQLLAYVRWATLEETGERAGKFEQGSVLASYNQWESSREPLTDDDDSLVEHNPSPSML